MSSSPRRRSLNLAIVAGVCPNLLGIFVAPIILIQIAERFGWRCGFFVVALPALACALLIHRFVQEPGTEVGGSAVPAAAIQNVRQRVVEVLRFRNVWLCAGLCCLVLAYTSTGFAFLPLYYIQVRGFEAQDMSLLMGVLGISSIMFALVLPIASERFGRRAVLILAGTTSVICPLSVLFYTGPIAVLAALVFSGWALSGIISFCAGTIPAETVPPRNLSTALGVIVGLGVVIGGLFGPTVAGWSADRWGLAAPLLLQTMFALAAALMAMLLRETAPLLQTDPFEAAKR